MHKYLAAGAAGAILIAGATLIRAADEKAGSVLRLGRALDSLIAPGTAVEKIASGFQFTEGPLWRPDGHLWFSDVSGNVLRSLTATGTVDVLIRNAGGESNAPPGAFVGPNGMTADKDGSVLLCQHTNRRIVRVGSDLRTTVYLDRFEGKRFNSPNDLVFRADGSLYFTDPPFGLPKQDQDAAKELPFNGVFRYANHRLQVVIRDLPRPNGIAFSPDGNTLYVSNSAEKRYWMVYKVAPDGSVSGGRTLLDVSSDPNPDVPDGMKVDSKGNLYAAGPGGVWVLSPEGKHLGTIRLPETVANCAWGDDGRSLYITASSSVYRVHLSVRGEAPIYR